MRLSVCLSLCLFVCLFVYLFSRLANIWSETCTLLWRRSGSSGPVGEPCKGTIRLDRLAPAQFESEFVSSQPEAANREPDVPTKRSDQGPPVCTLAKSQAISGQLGVGTSFVGLARKLPVVAS